MGYGIGRLSKYKLIDLSNDDTVAPSGEETQTLQPPQGKIYIVRLWRYYAGDPAGSGSGTHELRVKQGDLYYCNIKSNTGAEVSVNVNLGDMLSFNGDNRESPSDDVGQRGMITSFIRATYDRPVSFIYYNDTDVNQAANRTLNVFVEEIAEA